MSAPPQDPTRAWRYSGLALAAGALQLAGCSARESMLPAAGTEAANAWRLLGWMTGGSILIGAAVLFLAVYAAKRGPVPEQTAMRIVRYGTLGSVVILAILLVYGLTLLPMRADSPAGLTVSVYGEQWWWRFRVAAAGEPVFETANEIWLPAGAPVDFELRSDNVIHSFWVPALGSKMDLIPGRVNRLRLHPTRPGRYRGACAEFCGLGHARMEFEVNVVSPQEFQEWVSQQIRPALTAEKASPQ